MKTKQQGWSLIGVMFITALVLFVSLLAIRFIPIYIEHYYVVSSLNSLKDDGNYDQAINATSQRQKIRKSLIRRLDINSVRSVTNKDIFTSLARNGINVRIVYNANVIIFANIDATVHFDNQVVVPYRDY